MPGRRQRQRRGHGRQGTWFLEPVLLLLLRQQAAHGYTLIDQLPEYGLEGVHPRLVYRTLRDIEEMGWVVSSWDDEQTQGPPRRVYQLTPKGDQALQEHMRDLGQARGQIDRLTSAFKQQLEEGEGADR